jgi:hypothetical protein
MACCSLTSLRFLMAATWLVSASLSFAQEQKIAQAEGFDPLALTSAPVEKVDVQSNLKIYIEGAIGSSNQRYQAGSVDLRRASFDLDYSARLGPGLRFVLSDRVDNIHPVASGDDEAVNSLREAYLSWQPEGGVNIVDVGRVNLRFGPGYGYNPTDFFRDGSLRTVTTANPFALRENRLGTVILRGQRLWTGGSLSVAFSPKLATRPSTHGWSLDLGATNNRDRGVLVLGTKFSESVSTQLLAYKEDGQTPKIGASITALLSDAAVAHAEWSHGREATLLSRSLALPADLQTRSRFAGGLTYTTQGKLSLTAEYQYNGFAVNRAGRAGLAANPADQVAYLLEAQRLQDLASRQAVLIYVSQKDLGIKNLDLTAFLRVNIEDRSRLAWIELRHHWSNFDLAFQLQQNMGRSSSEYGILPDRRVVQVLGTYYF